MKDIESKEQVDCLGMGIIPFDLLFTVANYPEAGMKIDAKDFFMQGGGPVPNVMIGLTRLGFRTALIAVVGNDPFGHISIEEIKRENVDHRFVIVKDQPSALATGWIEEGSGRRTMVLSREIFVTAEDIDTDRYPVPRVVHLDGRDMPATMKLAKWARKIKAIVSFDIGSMRNDVSEVFPYVDHLVVADSYAFGFTATDNAVDAISKLAKRCPGTVVVTEGIKGSTGREADGTNYVHQPAYRVTNIDTTGAGDCYHSGYLYGLLHGYGLARRMQLGAAAGALKCTRPGARTGIPSEKELLKFLDNEPETY